MSLLTLKRPTPKRLRIIDGLIAEHVFGWKWFSSLGQSYLIPPWGQEEATNFKVHWTPGLKWRRIAEQKLRAAKKCYDIEHHYSDYERWALPKYSVDPAMAFGLIEALCKRYVTLNLMFTKPYSPPWQVHTAAASTLQLALCLYALDSLNIKLPWKSTPKRRRKKH